MEQIILYWSYEMLSILLVALGGSIGAVSRYQISLWTANRYGAGFPYGTLAANVIGCFIIGIFMTLITEKYSVSPYWRLLVTVGFVGGLTTFSSFSYETFKLLQDADVSGALWNLVLNMGLGFTATWLGISAARLF
jgi:CrcB protein